MKMSGIYKIQSKIKSERVYIGSSVNINERWLQHIRKLNKGNHHSRKLQNHYNKYGEADLFFKVITGCPREQLIAMEQFYIDALNPWFNISPNAGNTLGIKKTEEQRHEMSESRKGRKSPLKGTKLSPEHIIKLRNSHLGKTLPESQKEKIRSYRHSEDAKKRIGKALRGKPKKEETKIKMKEAWKLRKLKNIA